MRFAQLRAARIVLMTICAASFVGLSACNRGPDISTPKKAGTAFAKAMETGDMDTIHKCAVGTDAQFAMAKSFSDMFVASKQCQDAMKSKFGDQANMSKDMMGSNPFGDIENSEEKIDGDKATLVGKNMVGGGPTLKKDGDGWKIDLSDMAKGGGDISAMTKPMVDAMNATTKEINDGKFKTADEANQAYAQRLGAAMFGK